MGIIEVKNLVHEYIIRDEEGNVESIRTALDHMDLSVEPGQFMKAIPMISGKKPVWCSKIRITRLLPV